MNPPYSLVVPDDVQPDRADRILAHLLPGGPSRASVSKLLKGGQVLLNGGPIKPSSILNPGDCLEIFPREQIEERTEDEELAPLQILFEDQDIVVVDKPAGLVVHPGAGHDSGTLMDALVQTRPEMVGVGAPDRWGIVHRLDKDTSGVMVAAKTDLAHSYLSTRFKEHSIHRIYLALVRGNPGRSDGVIDAPLGRHQRDRKRISVATGRGRRAVTRWKVLERYGELTLLEIAPETGRTHQIRVHLASVGMPVAGDRVYGKTRKQGGIRNPAARSALTTLKRQALHASVLGFEHPGDGNYLEFTALLPPDMEELIRKLGIGKERQFL